MPATTSAVLTASTGPAPLDALYQAVYDAQYGFSSAGVLTSGTAAAGGPG